MPDERLKKLAEMENPEKVTHATIEFVDIAGLVKGASRGEGLGNKFLSHIREVDAIAHVVRCFEDPNVVHVDGDIDPIRDIETINIELNFPIWNCWRGVLNGFKNSLNQGKNSILQNFPFWKE